MSGVIRFMYRGMNTSAWPKVLVAESPCTTGYGEQNIFSEAKAGGIANVPSLARGTVRVGRTCRGDQGAEVEATT